MSQPTEPSMPPGNEHDETQSQPQSQPQLARVVSGVIETVTGPTGPGPACDWKDLPQGVSVTTVDVVARSERISAGYPNAESFQAPTDHPYSKSKRHASIEIIDNDENMRPYKRVDNGDGEDKTVSLVDFWQERYSKLSVRPLEGGQLALESPDGDSRIIETIFEGKLADTPPLPHDVVAEFLKRNKPGCPRAQAWIKAHEFNKGYRIFDQRSKILKKLEDNVDNGKAKVNPKFALAARLAARQKKTASRRARASNLRSVSGPTGSSAEGTSRQRPSLGPSLGPAMDVSAVRSALDAVKAAEAKGGMAIQDAPLGALGDIKKDREFHASVTGRIDQALGRVQDAHTGLLTVMYGDNIPERFSGPSNESAPKYPFGGFLSMENEKKFHENVIDGFDQAEQRFLGNVKEARGDITPKHDRPENPQQPKAPRRTSVGADILERTRELYPDDIEHAKQAHEKFQKAMFGGEDTSKVQFNEDDF